ncbi:C40 family peptidase [Halomonas kashgarensis]|uniref:C40 family peptidase n=1 Tax=Halomonas kashgarensis TaxID=3084920 RepID=UPI003A8F3275
MLALPRNDVPAGRIASCCIIMLLLAGCAGSPTTARQTEPDAEDYFAMTLPGLEGQWSPSMSPVDNPIAQLRSLQEPPPTIVRRALLAQHQRWAGTPYRLGGNNERGIDCSALVQSIYLDTFNMQLPRSTRGQVHEGRPIDRQALEAGDLVFFRPPGRYDHVGIYMGDGYFLHASSSQGVTISRLDNSYWQRYYWQARRTLEPTHLAQLNRTGSIASL